MRLPILLVLALGITSVTASADHAPHDEADPADPAPLVCEPPTPVTCADLDYRDSACGEESAAVCAGLLVDLYAGASYSDGSSRRSISLQPSPE
jgi:hypothetical protein